MKELIQSQRALKRAIYDAKAKLTDTEIFLSKAYNDFCNTIIEGVTKRFHRAVKIRIFSGGKGTTAYTDGTSVHVNIDNDLFQNPVRKSRNMLILGVLLHELGHVMFTDMKIAKEMSTRMSKNELYPMPDASEERDICVTTLLSEGLGKSFVEFQHTVHNICEDGFIEPVMMKLIPGYGECLRFLRSKHFASMNTYEEMCNNSSKKSEILTDMLLQYAKFRTVKGLPEEVDEIIAEFNALLPVIQKASSEKNAFLRTKAQNDVFCRIFCIIKEEVENNQQDQGQQGSSNNQQQPDESESDDNDNSDNSDPDSTDQNQNYSPKKNQTNSSDNEDEDDGEDDSDGDNENSESDNQDGSSQNNQSQSSKNESEDDDEGDSEGEGDEDSDSDSQEDSSQSNQSSENGDKYNDEDDSESASLESPNKAQNEQDEESNDEDEKGQDSDSNDVLEGKNEAQSSPTPSREDIKKALEEAAKNLTKQNQDKQENTERNNETSAVSTESLEESEQEYESEDGSKDKTDNSEKAASGLMDQIEDEIAEQQVAEDQEKAIKQELSGDLKEVSKYNAHRNVKSEMKRVEVSPTGERLYQEKHQELDAIARRLMKNLKREIKERQMGDKFNGLYMGRRVDSHSLYRQDKKVFNKNILPEDIPDMEVSILVDMSGSMYGERIETSRDAAYITYSFCNMLNVPVSVYGHTTYDKDVVMYSFTNPNSIDHNDGKRIFEMNANCSNRDGYALRFCLDKLEKSDAKTKIQMIISDGRPNHYGYGGQIAKEDMQSAVAKAKKNGILTIAAGIGEDSKSVRYFYTDGVSEKKSAVFLDITKLDRLSKTFVQIIKKHI